MPTPQPALRSPRSPREDRPPAHGRTGLLRGWVGRGEGNFAGAGPPEWRQREPCGLQTIREERRQPRRAGLPPGEDLPWPEQRGAATSQEQRGGRLRRFAKGARRARPSSAPASTNPRRPPQRVPELGCPAGSMNRPEVVPLTRNDYNRRDCRTAAASALRGQAPARLSGEHPRELRGEYDALFAAVSRRGRRRWDQDDTVST